MGITSLGRKDHKGKQDNKFGKKRPINKTDINKGQEVPRINLNLKTKATQYLVQQGQAKEGGGGEGSKKNFKDLKETYKIYKEHLTEIKQHLRSHAHAEDP